MSLSSAVELLEQRGVLLDASSCVGGTFGLRIPGADSHWFGFLRGYSLRCGGVAPGLLHMLFRSVAFVSLVGLRSRLTAAGMAVNTLSDRCNCGGSN